MIQYRVVYISMHTCNTVCLNVDKRDIIDALHAACFCCDFDNVDIQVNNGDGWTADVTLSGFQTIEEWFAQPGMEKYKC